MKRIFQNCFILLIPVFIWNITLSHHLPIGYTSKEIWDSVPNWLSTLENMMRAFAFLMPLFMIFSIKLSTQKWGFSIYFIGILIYFGSWSMQMFCEESKWSQSLIGFMAPAFTTIIWFIGIVLVGKESILSKLKLQKSYLFAVVLFVLIHSYHTYLAYDILMHIIAH